MDDQARLVLASVLVVSICWIGFRVLEKRRRLGPLSYPPGPKPRFLLGNLLEIPKTNMPEGYAEWGAKLNSEIVHFAVLGLHIVVVNSRPMAEAMLENAEKGGLYDDRPEFPTLDVIGWEYNFSIMRYGELWRKHRKICHQRFNKRAAEYYHPIESERVRVLLKSLLKEPEKWSEHVKMFSVSITLSMMYGYTPNSLNDPVVKAGEEALLTGASLVAPGGSAMTIIPMLRHIPPWVPGATSQKLAAHVKRLTLEMQRIPLDHVTNAMREGTAAPSFVTNFLERKHAQQTTEEEETIVNNIAHTVYGAASDTTISALGSIIYVLVAHPEVVLRAQKEIDSVVGKERLPTFDDRPSLPYIDAIYREALRLYPPVSLGVAHATQSDDIFEGYLIPKGAIIMANIWAMNRDERLYSDPLVFKPERFINDDGTLSDDSRVYAFGFGRRICVGQHIASDTIFLTLASLLTCFNFGKAKDDFGNVIDIEAKWIDFSGLSHIKPFNCSIKPRSADVQRLLEDD